MSKRIRFKLWSFALAAGLTVVLSACGSGPGTGSVWAATPGMTAGRISEAADSLPRPGRRGIPLIFRIPDLSALCRTCS